MPASQLVLVTLFGMLLSYTKLAPTDGEDKAPRQSLIRCTWVFCMPVLVCVLGTYSFYAFTSYQLYQKTLPLGAPEEYRMKIKGPRFWVDGGIVEPTTPDRQKTD